MLEGWSYKLGDLFCSYGHHEQTLKRHQQEKLFSKLSRRFAQLEFPLLFLSFFLHPKYFKIGITKVDHSIVILLDVVKFVSGYSKLCCLSDVDPTAAVFEWMSYETSSPWCQHKNSCHRIPHQFWCVVGRMRNVYASVHVVAHVAMEMFSIMPNAEDPERVFPYLGSLMTPTRVNLSICTIKHPAVIFADVRERQLDLKDVTHRQTSLSKQYSAMLVPLFKTIIVKRQLSKRTLFRQQQWWEVPNQAKREHFKAFVGCVPQRR